MNAAAELGEALLLPSVTQCTWKTGKEVGLCSQYPQVLDCSSAGYGLFCLVLVALGAACPAGQETETCAECPGRRGPRCGWKLKFKLLFLSFCDGTRAVLGSTRQQRRWLCWYWRLGGTSAVLLNSKSAAMFAIHVQSGGFPASAVVFISKITFGTIGSATFTASF